MIEWGSGRDWKAYQAVCSCPSALSPYLTNNSLIILINNLTISEGDPADTDVRVDSVSRGSSSMHLTYGLIEGINDVFVDWVSSESDAEIIIGASHQLNDGLLALIIDVVCAQINVLELNVLKEHASLNLLPICICICGVLNHVQ